jgi:hypothetical protein
LERPGSIIIVDGVHYRVLSSKLSGEEVHTVVEEMEQGFTEPDLAPAESSSEVDNPDE